MDRVIAALVGGLFTLAAAILVAYRREIMELIRSSTIDVRGVWTGQCERIPLQDPYSVSSNRFDIRFVLEQTGRKVSGTGFVRDEELEGEIELSMTVTNSRYLMVEWCDPDSNAQDRGVAILELVDYGKRLRGLYLALPLSDAKLICGKIEVTKN